MFFAAIGYPKRSSRQYLTTLQNLRRCLALDTLNFKMVKLISKWWKMGPKTNQMVRLKTLTREDLIQGVQNFKKGPHSFSSRKPTFQYLMQKYYNYFSYPRDNSMTSTFYFSREFILWFPSFLELRSWGEITKGHEYPFSNIIALIWTWHHHGIFSSISLWKQSWC